MRTHGFNFQLRKQQIQSHKFLQKNQKRNVNAHLVETEMITGFVHV